MRLTQGCFSFLPDLTKEQVRKQIEYAMNEGWALSIEYTDNPHPRNCYWEMWGLPMFELRDPDAALWELEQVAKVKTVGDGYYIKLSAFDNTRGVESCVMSFIVQRPEVEIGFRLIRNEASGREIRYTVDHLADALALYRAEPFFRAKI
jgi:ribulose-bisphosphate carboxylase small chain